MDKCSYCGKEGDLLIHYDYQSFCCSECSKNGRYVPEMTDETWKPETVIDEIELDGGKEFIQMQTPDSFYADAFKYKVIVVQFRFFSHKQLCGFRTIKDAKAAWERLKEKKGFKSWYDIQRAKKEGKDIAMPKSQQKREQPHVKINPKMTNEQIVSRIKDLKALGLGYAKDLVRLADLMENTEPYSRTRNSLNRDYGKIVKLQKLADDEVEQLEKLLISRPIHCHTAEFGSEVWCKTCNPHCADNHGPNKLQFCGHSECPMNPKKIEIKRAIEANKGN